MKRWTLPSLKLDLDSPFREIGGLLEFKEGFTEPEFFIHWSFMTELYGEQLFIDHCVITFPNCVSLESYADALRLYNAQIVEGLGLFPVDFCPDTYTLTTDLWMYFLTMLMPSGGLLVLNSPYSLGDEKDRFIEERGLAAVHHVAIRVDNMHDAALLWQQKGFQPLSLEPIDGSTICQWFLENSAGQIIELIRRSHDNKNTFHCQNIGSLRLAEVTE